MNEETAAEVTTKLGRVRGRKCARLKRENSKQVYRFAGIPFAKPPLGELRFEPPQKAEPWEGVLNAKAKRPQPMQAAEYYICLDKYVVSTNEFNEELLDVSEDCLYLDIYTSEPNDTAKFPVLFWLYGGGFNYGSSCKFDGSVIAGLHQVVVVVPNYRLGAFGFFNLPRTTADNGTSPCPGNMGMLDQCMALEWTRDNIGCFGGDPGNVTMFGESAGSISVDLHMTSPLSRGLFHKAICHSGVRDYPLLVGRDNGNARRLFLEQLEISADTDGREMMKKLKELPAQQLVQATINGMNDWLRFGVIENDGKFLQGNITQYSDIPCILGVCTTEGFGVNAPADDPEFRDGLNCEKAFKALQNVTHTILQPDQQDRILRSAFEEYATYYDKDDPFLWSKVIGSIFSDICFVVPTVRTAKSLQGPAYLYCMAQRLRYSHDRNYNLEESPQLKPEFCHCDHQDDTIFTFGTPLAECKLTLNVKFSKEEQELSRMWIKYLTNFATTGNPNEGPSDVAVPWKAYNNRDEPYLLVSENTEMKNRLMAKRIQFWDSIS